MISRKVLFNSLLTISIVIIGGIHFYINRFVKLPAISAGTIKLHLSQVPSFLFGWLQWTIVVAFIEPHTGKKPVIQLTILTIGIFLIDASFILCIKLFPEITFLYKIWGITHGLVKFYATGLIAILGVIFLKYYRTLYEKPLPH
jgi:hypothetical protein